MYRGRNQDPRTWQTFDARADVRGVERPLGAQGDAALQAHEHRRFETVHMLSGHCTEHGVGAAVGKPETPRALAHALHQPTPGLLMRYWHASRSGSEDVGNDLFGVDLRRRPGWLVDGRLAGKVKARQRHIAARIIRQAEGIRRKLRELADDRRREG